MKRFPLPAAVLLLVASLATAEEPKVLVSGLKSPTGVAVGGGGKIYVTVLGDKSQSGSGAVMRIDNGKPVAFAKGLDEPFAIAAFQQWLFVLDKRGLIRISASGKSEVLAPNSAFQGSPHSLASLAVDPESGMVYVSEWGYSTGEFKDAVRHPGDIYRVNSKGKAESVLRKASSVDYSGLAMDGQSHLIALGHREFQRIKIANGSIEKFADLPGRADLCVNPIWDHNGRLFVLSPLSGFRTRILAIPRPSENPIHIGEQIVRPSAMCLDASGKKLHVVDSTAGTLTAVPIQIPGWEVDETPMPLHTEVAFPNLKWTGWKGETDDGKANPLRPLVLTHAGDGSDRVFVATEHGVIHVFPNDQKATKTKIFLDIQDRVSYRDDQNEEGFLGLAFHPKFKENGEFFVFYTTKKKKLTNVVSRLRVSKDDPDRADPNSEEELMRFEKPFWNHDGGTLAFGPDGYLYLTHGDGGAANDPFDNGQNLKSLLGKIHRIDVDHKDAGKNYAIPKDNPFVGVKDARPEIWAYGLRNVWRMAFDRQTGKLWASDVGQNLYEEIDLIEKGGNYGWNRREGLHPFGPKGTGPRKEFIDPIWEYHHDVGKSITGGLVYRGKRLPELQGMYLYGDYVTTKIWALTYDEAKKRVTANRPIKDRGVPIFSFGEDEKGEAYLLGPSNTGQGIYWFVK